MNSAVSIAHAAMRQQEAPKAAGTTSFVLKQQWVAAAHTLQHSSRSYPQALGDDSSGVVVVQERVNQAANDSRAAKHTEESKVGRSWAQVSLSVQPVQARPTRRKLPLHSCVLPCSHSAAAGRHGSTWAHLNSRPGQRPLPPSSTLSTRVSNRSMPVACSKCRDCNNLQCNAMCKC